MKRSWEAKSVICVKAIRPLFILNGLYKERTELFSNQRRLKNGANIELSSVSKNYFIKQRNASDNINKNGVHGLDFILQLKPVTYNMDVRKLNQFLGVDGSAAGLQNDEKQSPEEQLKLDQIEEQAIREKESVVYSGFIAQDVEQAAKAVNYNFSGVIAPVNEKDHYSVSYEEFVVPLVKAVQEQQKQIEELKKMIEKLSRSTLAANTNIELNDKNAVVLNQNVPNPFAEKTIITYNIPQNAGKAQVLFYNAAGQVIKTSDILSKGQGQITVFANDLSSGIYSYSLIVDRRVMDTKRMAKQ